VLDPVDIGDRRGDEMAGHGSSFGFGALINALPWQGQTGFAPKISRIDDSFTGNQVMVIPWGQGDERCVAR
jgi:hypothetical protein